MSEDNRQRPHILRVLPAVNVRVRAYATRQGIAPNVAAEGLINGAAAEIAALDSQLVALRAELESAREATRRADAVLAELEQANRDLALDVASLRKMHAAEKGAHERCAAEVARLTAEATVRARGYALAAAKLGTENDRLTSELAEAKRTADKLRIEVERVTEERDTERRLDVTAQEALRADVAREIEAAKRAEKEVERLRAELAATRPAPCACAALPDDFEAKLTERAPGWPGTLPELRARVIQLGFSRYDALATDAAKRAAERAARG